MERFHEVDALLLEPLVPPGDELLDLRAAAATAEDERTFTGGRHFHRQLLTRSQPESAPYAGRDHDLALGAESGRLDLLHAR